MDNNNQNSTEKPQILSMAVFPNLHKKTPSQPDYKISAKLKGEYREIGAGWKRQGTKGTFLSLSVNMDRMREMVMEKMAQEPTTSKGDPLPNFDVKDDVTFDNF